MARINDWKVISTIWSYQLLFFPFGFVVLHIFSLLEANRVLHVTSNQPSVTMEKNQTLSLTKN
jgi:hypothetical protein